MHTDRAAPPPSQAAPMRRARINNKWSPAVGIADRFAYADGAHGDSANCMPCSGDLCIQSSTRWLQHRRRAAHLQASAVPLIAVLHTRAALVCSAGCIVLEVLMHGMHS